MKFIPLIAGLVIIVLIYTLRSKSKPELSIEESLKSFIENLEKSYCNKDEEKLFSFFHPDCRNISLLDDLNMKLIFQIYELNSEIIHFEHLSSDSNSSTFTYARNQFFSSIDDPSINDGKDNVSCFYVTVAKHNGSFQITRYQSYASAKLNDSGEVEDDVLTVVSPRNSHYDKIRPLLSGFDLNNFQPLTYRVWDDSELLGFYPKSEMFRYNPSVELNFNFFEKMEANSFKEHTEDYLNQPVISNKLHFEADEFSIIETSFEGKNGKVEQEILLSLLADDGFYMIKYLADENAFIDSVKIVSIVEQMKKAVEYKTAS